ARSRIRALRRARFNSLCVTRSEAWSRALFSPRPQAQLIGAQKNFGQVIHTDSSVAADDQVGTFRIQRHSAAGDFSNRRIVEDGPGRTVASVAVLPDPDEALARSEEALLVLHARFCRAGTPWRPERSSCNDLFSFRKEFQVPSPVSGSDAGFRPGD